MHFLKTLLFLLLCITGTAAFAQPDTTQPIVPYAKVGLPPVTRHCQEALGDFKPCFVEAMLKYVSENYNYPALADSAGLTATVYVSFVVEVDGTVSSVEVIRGAGHGINLNNNLEMLAAESLNREAVRVIQALKFIAPAKINHEPVRMSFAMPVQAAPNKTEN